MYVNPTPWRRPLGPGTIAHEGRAHEGQKQLVRQEGRKVEDAGTLEVHYLVANVIELIRQPTHSSKDTEPNPQAR